MKVDPADYHQRVMREDLAALDKLIHEGRTNDDERRLLQDSQGRTLPNDEGQLAARASGRPDSVSQS